MGKIPMKRVRDEESAAIFRIDCIDSHKEPKDRTNRQHSDSFRPRIEENYDSSHHESEDGSEKPHSLSLLGYKELVRQDLEAEESSRS